MNIEYKKRLYKLIPLIDRLYKIIDDENIKSKDTLITINRFISAFFDFLINNISHYRFITSIGKDKNKEKIYELQKRYTTKINSIDYNPDSLRYIEILLYNLLISIQLEIFKNKEENIPLFIAEEYRNEYGEKEYFMTKIDSQVFYFEERNFDPEGGIFDLNEKGELIRIVKDKLYKIMVSHKEEIEKLNQLINDSDYYTSKNLVNLISKK